MAGEAEQQFENTLAPWRERVVTHPLYAHLRDEGAIRLFMAAHVFAVLDFQSLLKSLQRLVTCVDVPWLPTSDPQARRLLNEIVLDEESDQAPGGGYLSHFEIYLQAMRECGANVTPIQIFLGHVRAGLPVEQALEASALPPGVGLFVRATMAIARSTEPHRTVSRRPLPTAGRKLPRRCSSGLRIVSRNSRRSYGGPYATTSIATSGRTGTVTARRPACSCVGSAGTTTFYGPRRRDFTGSRGQVLGRHRAYAHFQGGR